MAGSISVFPWRSRAGRDLGRAAISMGDEYVEQSRTADTVVVLKVCRQTFNVAS